MVPDDPNMGKLGALILVWDYAGYYMDGLTLGSMVVNFTRSKPLGAQEKRRGEIGKRYSKGVQLQYVISLSIMLFMASATLAC